MSSAKSETGSSNRGLLEQFGFFRFAVPPILVLLLGYVLFSTSMLGIRNDVGLTVRCHASPNVKLDGKQILHEASARFMWASAAILNIVASISATLVSGIIMCQNLGRERIKPVIILGGVICLIAVAAVISGYITRTAPARGIYYFTFDVLCEAKSVYEPVFIRCVFAVLLFINVFVAAIAPIVVILAVCTCLAPALGERPRQLERLARQLRNLRIVLYLGSALLVGGILHMGAWLHWPAALVAEADMHDAISELAFGVAGYWGMTYSLTAIVLFVPADQRLRAHAQMLLEECPEIEDPKKWLQEHEFTRSPWQHLGEISVLLAPLLAVPFGHLLSSLPG